MKLDPAARAQILLRWLRTESVRSTGRLGETVAKVRLPKTKIPSQHSRRQYRVPDILTDAELVEVKNTSYLCLTGQLRDFLSYCNQTDRTLRLITRENTRLSAPLRVLVDRGEVRVDHLGILATPEGVKKISDAIARMKGFRSSTKLWKAALSGAVNWESAEKHI